MLHQYWLASVNLPNVCTLLLALTLSIPPLCGKAAEATPLVQVAKVSGFADDAAFLFYLDGNLVLTNFVVWKTNGTFASKGEAMTEGHTIRMETSLSSDVDGRWCEVSMVMPIHKTGVKRSGNNAVLTLPEGDTRTVLLNPGVFPFVGMLGLNLYTRFYDEAKGGKQSLPILIPHKKADKLTMEQKRSFQRTLGVKKLRLREFEVKTAGMDAIIWIDDRGRLIKSAQPEEGAIFIRSGYEMWREER